MVNAVLDSREMEAKNTSPIKLAVPSYHAHTQMINAISTHIRYSSTYILTPHDINFFAKRDFDTCARAVYVCIYRHLKPPFFTAIIIQPTSRFLADAHGV